ncbi:hypothetical protein Cgig2_024280 [Carnegiea gigantea]|uniref:Uncharacterized protein n=1 Tax=Carnegiea gigantea TaxID=171969 RepID=A0A9Q1GUZ5_9CARY|nr:hypothetical protein Cgig2_024280 [Carnegiea gigantea]
MQIDAIERTLWATEIWCMTFHKEKEALPEGVVIVDSQPDIIAVAVQIINYDVEDVVTRCVTTSAQCISTPLLPGPIMLCSQGDNDPFVDRSLMRIAEPDLQIRRVQTTTNTNKGKAILVKAPKRRRTRAISQLKEQLKKEVVPEKPVKKRPKKMKARKEKCEETISKKAKRGNSAQQAREANESLQKSVVKEMKGDSSVGKVEAKEGKK